MKKPELNEAQERAAYVEQMHAAFYEYTGEDQNLPDYDSPQWTDFAAGYEAARRASSAQQVEAVSIDTPEFREKVGALLDAYEEFVEGEPPTPEARQAWLDLCGYINRTKLRQAATGSADGLDAKRLDWLAEQFKYNHIGRGLNGYVYNGTVIEGNDMEFREAIDAAILAQHGVSKNE